MNHDQIEEIERKTNEKASDTSYYEAKTAAYAKGLFEILILMAKGLADDIPDKELKIDAVERE